MDAAAAATAMEAVDVEGDSKMQSRRFGINKYTLICSVLASTNSILLGYGKSFFLFTGIYSCKREAPFHLTDLCFVFAFWVCEIWVNS